jgi:murein L,D-transpeptidase YcbB/YkuD
MKYCAFFSGENAKSLIRPTRRGAAAALCAIAFLVGTQAGAAGLDKPEHSPAPILKTVALNGLATDLSALPPADAPDLRTWLGAGHIEGRALSDAEAIRAFYKQRNNASFWTGARGPNESARDLVAVLEDAWTHGLNPAKYDLAALDRLMETAVTSPADRAALEIRLTDALVRYGRDITGTRTGRSEGEASIRRKPMDAQTILSLAATSGDLKSSLTALAPRGPLYRALREELIRLASAGGGTGYGQEALRFSSLPLYPGDSDAGVPALRARLGLEADPSPLYDDALAQAVAAFQRSRRLSDDGIVGPMTLSALNATPAHRMNQILANMERLRWLDQDRPDRYIIVNIPSQTLWAVGSNQVIHEMKVIVGKPVRGTKDFKATITGVRFNPTWTVPPTIKRKDFLPKLINNPGYLGEKGITLLQRQGGKMVRVDPYAVDWSSVSGSDLAGMSMVQGAGDRNALGKVRVLMPNPYDMYLHDTSSPELFAETQRTLSSGCVRIENPEAVADFILSSNEGWSVDKMREMIDRGRTVDVKTEHPIPVYIIYQTAWLDSHGQLVFGEDVYGRDKALLQALKASDELPVFRAG